MNVVERRFGEATAIWGQDKFAHQNQIALIRLPESAATRVLIVRVPRAARQCAWTTAGTLQGIDSVDLFITQVPGLTANHTSTMAPKLLRPPMAQGATNTI